jgi:hypothetical protein
MLRKLELRLECSLFSFLSCFLHFLYFSVILFVLGFLGVPFLCGQTTSWLEVGQIKGAHSSANNSFSLPQICYWWRTVTILLTICFLQSEAFSVCSTKLVTTRILKSPLTIKMWLMKSNMNHPFHGLHRDLNFWNYSLYVDSMVCHWTT